MHTKTKDDAIKKQEFRRGIPENFLAEAADLYDEAFGEKFSPAIRSKTDRVELFKSSFHVEFCFCAIMDSRLVGLAGFQTKEGALTAGITFRSLISHLGFFRGSWAAFILSLYDRKASLRELVLDGISVSSGFQGNGIGTKLLDELTKFAADEGYKSIRLDVIDTNERARKLYERKGFIPVKTEHFEYLRWLLGFGASTTMLLTLS